MKPPAIRRFFESHTGRRDERGVTMILVAVAMVAIIAMAAMSIDLVTLYLAREEAQRSADTAALAAARVISTSGLTGDPTNASGLWGSICGGSTSAASYAAQAVGGQNSVGNLAPSVTVTYSAGGGGSADCATLAAGGAFGVNPLVTVQIQRTSLPTFFSRIWGKTTNTITVTATAEVFNPSASDLTSDGGPTGTVTPVQPRCVKPWIVPNLDPQNPHNNNGTTCPGVCPLVSTTDGSIENPGITLGGGGATGVIGETFSLFADCGPGTSCVMVNSPPRANAAGGAFTGGAPPTGPNLEYLPGLAENSSLAVPSCATTGSGANTLYEPAVGGCDQSTIYQCGVLSSNTSTPNQVDLTENPGGAGGDTANGVVCAINQSTLGPGSNGEDTLDYTSAYPFQMKAGTSNPTGLNGTLVTASNSIMSLPIYDQTLGTVTTSTPNVTIVGFLQVFVNYVNTDGSLNVTVLNVAGCGNGSSGPPNTPITGSSPVPIRLITPP